MPDPERAAAISIIEQELGSIETDSRSTQDLWQIIFFNTECFASQFRENILNDGKPWHQIAGDIKHSTSINDLKNIYNHHPKLQKHKPFLDCLTARKKKIKYKIQNEKAK